MSKYKLTGIIYIHIGMREKERERERGTDRQTETERQRQRRDRDRETDRDRDRERQRHTPIIAFRHPPPKKDIVNQCLEFETETDRQTDRHPLTEE